MSYRANPGARSSTTSKARNLAPWIREQAACRLWKTGHWLIRRECAERGAALAAEMSGHTFFAQRWYGSMMRQYARGAAAGDSEQDARATAR